MAYVALYRSYRPKTFEEVIGQKHVVQTLKNAVMENKTSHAYIFSGLRGIGKTTIARILAKAVNCKNPVDGEPCNNCESCLAIINDETTDIVELDAASNNGVDEMRDILEKVNFLPSVLTKKVYIIDEAHMLSNAAFNALLKTLEEPPVHVIFILATTEPHKIPATILSRCQRFDFKQFTLEELKQELKYVCQKENIDIEEAALAIIAEAADGGMRDALSILDQASVFANGTITSEDVDSVTGRISTYKLIELINAFKEKDATKSIEIVDSLVAMGKEVSRLISGIIQFCRDLLLYKSSINLNNGKHIYNNEDFKNLAEKLSTNELFYYMDVLIDVQNKIRFTNSQKIYLEVGIVKIINKVDDTVDVMNKLQKLESDISNNTTGTLNIDYDSKFNTIDNKIKTIFKELDRNNLDEFKEKIDAKIELLEDVSTKAVNIPNDISYRLDGIEDKIRVINNNIGTSLDNKVIEELTNKITLLEEQFNSNSQIDVKEDNNIEDNIKYQTFEAKILNLEKIISILDEKIQALPLQNINTIVDKTDVEKEVAELKENYFVLIEKMQTMQSSNLNNLDDLGFDTSDIYNEENNSTKHLEDLVNGVVSNINRISDKLNSVEEIVNNANKNVEAVNLESSNTKNKVVEIIKEVENVKNKINDTTDHDKIIVLEEENKNLKEEIEKLKKVLVNKSEPVKENVVVKEKAKEETYIKPVETPRVVETNEEKTIQKIHNVYDVRIVERILHESRELECREEKARLIAGWNKLDDKVGYMLAGVSRILMDGKLAANGKREILIVFPSATMCNHLMEQKNYIDAKQVLRITFGKDYDFLALPENTWQEKRKEYIGQYGVGIKYPKLTPINNPELTVVTVNYDQIKDTPKKPLQQARAFFGNDIVEEEDK